MRVEADVACPELEQEAGLLLHKGGNGLEERGGGEGRINPVYSCIARRLLPESCGGTLQPRHGVLFHR